MDNYCNSDTLSQKLMEKCKTTHTIGTLMANRKQNPKVVTMPKLKKDNRDVLAITTKYYPQLIEVRNRYGQVKIKPREISEYNNYMSGVDRCNQLTSYYSCPRKTIRWYKKIIFHLLDVTVLNAFIMYREKKNKKMRFAEFRDQLINLLLHLPENLKFESLCLRKMLPVQIRRIRRTYQRFHIFPRRYRNLLKTTNGISTMLTADSVKN
nr:unnamed protein product [Callosobruchus analis]